MVVIETKNELKEQNHVTIFNVDGQSKWAYCG
jgi:hypothetical protein